MKLTYVLRDIYGVEKLCVDMHTPEGRAYYGLTSRKTLDANMIAHLATLGITCVEVSRARHPGAV